MTMPQLHMQSQFIQLGLQIQKAQQSIEQPKAELSIEQPAAILEIETTPGKLYIDQTEARADIDLKSVRRRVEEFAQNGYRDWLKGIARRARQGRELKDIHKAGNPIAAQAKENSTKPLGQYTIAWIPSYFSVKLHYEPAKVDIRAIPQKPRIEAEIHKPIHEYIPGDVKMYIDRWNKLDIEVVNLFDEKG
ncbi:hypothetical protein J9303_11805 [Bacillaceae bacterium Marseille-Q3522]|nr:hypothetical protein [Bacillaceae bacterium Marseille-Q3522]